MTFPDYLAAQAQSIEAALDRLIPPGHTEPATIHRAMRYSVFAGGKRIRPILCLEAACAVTSHVPAALPVACSLELIHTYSLIHDDLPALDNDDYRRGKLTCHKVFGDAMAILAGDSLLTLAFQVLSAADAPADVRIALVRELSQASGTVGGMIGGQVADLEGSAQHPTAELLESIHRAKTGALLRASVRMGAFVAQASPGQVEALSRYGSHIGLAFQIVDDLLDVEGSTQDLGKTPGKDAAQQKITFPAVYGLEKSRQMAAVQKRLALDALQSFGASADRLRELAALIVDRRA